MVAAWMSAETGVGPSMASGSQVWKGHWPDLPQAAASRSRPMARLVPSGRLPALLNTVAKSRLPMAPTMRNMASRKPTSATRLVRNAFLPAVAAAGLVCQKEMRR